MLIYSSNTNISIFNNNNHKFIYSWGYLWTKLTKHTCKVQVNLLLHPLWAMDLLSETEINRSSPLMTQIIIHKTIAWEYCVITQINKLFWRLAYSNRTIQSKFKDWTLKLNSSVLLSQYLLNINYLYIKSGSSVQKSLTARYFVLATN